MPVHKLVNWLIRASMCNATLSDYIILYYINQQFRDTQMSLTRFLQCFDTVGLVV